MSRRVRLVPFRRVNLGIHESIHITFEQFNVRSTRLFNINHNGVRNWDELSRTEKFKVRRLFLIGRDIYRNMMTKHKEVYRRYDTWMYYRSMFKRENGMSEAVFRRYINSINERKENLEQRLKRLNEDYNRLMGTGQPNGDRIRYTILQLQSTRREYDTFLNSRRPIVKIIYLENAVKKAMMNRNAYVIANKNKLSNSYGQIMRVIVRDRNLYRQIMDPIVGRPDDIFGGPVVHDALPYMHPVRRRIWFGSDVESESESETDSDSE